MTGPSTPRSSDLLPGEMAIGFDSVWVVESESDRVARLDWLMARSPTRSRSVGRPLVSRSAKRRLGDERWRRDCRPDRRRANTVSKTLPAGSSPEGDRCRRRLAMGRRPRRRRAPADRSDLREYRSGRARRPMTAVAFTQGVWVAVSPSGLARVDGDQVTFEHDVGQGPSAVTYALDRSGSRTTAGARSPGSSRRRAASRRRFLSEKVRRRWPVRGRLGCRAPTATHSSRSIQSQTV